MPHSDFSVNPGNIARAGKATIEGKDNIERLDLANPAQDAEARRRMRNANQNTYTNPEVKRDEETIAEAATLDRDPLGKKVLMGQTVIPRVLPKLLPKLIPNAVICAVEQAINR